MRTTTLLDLLSQTYSTFILSCFGTQNTRLFFISMLTDFCKNNFMECLWRKYLAMPVSSPKLLYIGIMNFGTLILSMPQRFHLTDILKWHLHASFFATSCCRGLFQNVMNKKKKKETTARLLQIFLVAPNLFTINGCLKLAKFQLSFSSLKVWIGFFNHFGQFEWLFL